MKVPIALSELGLVVKSDGGYFFYRNGSYAYERKNIKGSIMTFERYKEKYPVEIGYIFYRKRAK